MFSSLSIQMRSALYSSNRITPLNNLHDDQTTALTLRNSRKAGLDMHAFLISAIALVKLLTYSLYTSSTMDLENCRGGEITKEHFEMCHSFSLTKKKAT